MADVVIRGMEEPPFCHACQMLEGSADDGFCHAANKWLDDEYFCWYQYPDGDIATDKPLNCPLLALPEGHGRLIDADAIDTTYSDPEVIETLQEAPTVIPAEGGGEDGN